MCVLQPAKVVTGPLAEGRSPSGYSCNLGADPKPYVYSLVTTAVVLANLLKHSVSLAGRQDHADDTRTDPPLGYGTCLSLFANTGA